MLLVADIPRFYFTAIGLNISLDSWPCFCFRAIYLMVGLVINTIILMASKIDLNLLTWSL